MDRATPGVMPARRSVRRHCQLILATGPDPRPHCSSAVPTAARARTRACSRRGSRCRGPHPVRLGPGADVTKGADRRIEAPPGLQVRVVPILGEPLQVLKRAALLDDERRRQQRLLVPEQPRLGRRLQVPPHAGHRGEDGPRRRERAWWADLHADRADDRVVTSSAEVSGVTHVLDLRHTSVPVRSKARTPPTQPTQPC